MNTLQYFSEIAGSQFTPYPRPRRDRWPDVPLSPLASNSFKSCAFPFRELRSVLDNGVDTLNNADLAELLINPFALYDTFDAIDETQPDNWIDKLVAVSQEIAGSSVTVSRPKPLGRPTPSVWIQRVAA